MNSPTYDGLTVYIVEDDAAMRDSLSLMLGLLGFRTVSFESAEAFLETYRDEWVGCVVADLRLPGMSGLELQAESSRAGQEIAVCDHHRTRGREIGPRRIPIGSRGFHRKAL